MSRRILCDWTGKVVHFSRTAAKEVMRHMGQREVYRCPHCKYWHTATWRNKGKKRKKERIRG